MTAVRRVALVLALPPDHPLATTPDQSPPKPHPPAAKLISTQAARPTAQPWKDSV
ncbi:hypothetical protein B0H19DRAFT_1104735 [Mycena capillaripes]|nr:hypothetical protein B0H19DRAFT_1104735 [Mycena capillaripes]